MNLRYSRPFEETKKQFVQVFGSDEAYEEVLSATTRDDADYQRKLVAVDKQKFYKRQKIYDLMAEEELQRIITSLFTSKSNSATTHSKSFLTSSASINQERSNLTDPDELLEEEKNILLTGSQVSRSDTLVVRQLVQDYRVRLSEEIFAEAQEEDVRLEQG